MDNKIYLGDGVYYEFDGYQVWLYTHDGIGLTNRIALEPEVILELLKQPVIQRLTLSLEIKQA